jgi:hypothetical protein
MPAPLRIAILDPALGNSGAHNAGFAASLAKNRHSDGEAGIWCHQSLPDTERAALSAAGITVAHPFSVRFYELFGQGGTPVEHAAWISRLAAEYRAALEQVLKQWPSGPVLVVYHTLSWEHGLALAEAIATLGEDRLRLRHMILLMYSPGLDANGMVWNATLRANFAAAFGALAQQPHVTLYASCSEYATAYAALLGREHPLPLHPCFLGDWGIRARKAAAIDTHLLYLGVVKADKGFFELPDRLKSLLRQADPEARYVIQYFGPGGKINARSRSVADALAKLAKKHPQIILHEGFWSDEELLARLESAVSLNLSYDAHAYRHKTSGLLWLAAWHGIAVTVPADSWLEREAQRLGMDYATQENGRVRPLPAADCDNAYFRTLFSPFWPWAEAQWRHLSAQ